MIEVPLWELRDEAEDEGFGVGSRGVEHGRRVCTPTEAGIAGWWAPTE